MTDSSTFRLQSKHLFLTYPQCNLDKQDVLDQLRTKLLRYNPIYILVGREKHESGDPHLHSYVHLGLRPDIRSSTFLDLTSTEVVFHGNYQAARRPVSTIAYCEKEGDTIEYGSRDGDSRPCGWGSLITSATTADEFQQLVLQHYPRDAVLNSDRIRAFANEHYGRRQHTDYQPEFTSFTIPTPLQQWLDETFTTAQSRPVSLCLIGNSRLGKTEWARSLGTHMYFCGMINLDEWDDNAKYMVMDDFDWKFVPSKKQLIGAQKQIVLTDKYRKKTTVKWGKPVIYLCNFDSDPFNFMTPTEMSWYELNFKKIIINEKLF